jgi:hypothetical protein
MATISCSGDSGVAGGAAKQRWYDEQQPSPAGIFHVFSQTDSMVKLPIGAGKSRAICDCLFNLETAVDRFVVQVTD